MRKEYEVKEAEDTEKKEKHVVSTQTSRKTLHNASHQCWHHACMKAFSMALKSNGNARLEPLKILWRINRQHGIYEGKNRVFVGKREDSGIGTHGIVVILA